MSTSSLNNGLAATLFGKARRAILSLLYGHADEAFYLRQIVRATGIGLGPAQRELKMMTEAGIVIRERKGNLVYYRANSSSPIFNELKNIVRKTFGVADVVREALAPISKNIRVAFIFGSVAKSTDDRRSDIDLMIVGKVSFGDVVSLLSPAEEKLGREITPVVYPIDEFKRKVKEDHHFVKTVLEEEKIFVIGDENELTRLAP
jgi:predicted nucleotidyltransferase